MTSEVWVPIKDGDPRARGLYNRHYSAEPIDPRRARRPLQFVGPGEKLVLLTVACDALFVWKRDRFIDGYRPPTRYDGQQGIRCTIFRNESPHRSSELILEAEQWAWQRWPEDSRLITYVNPHKIRSTNPGFCFLKAGWNKAGQSKNGLILFEKVRDAV